MSGEQPTPEDKARKYAFKAEAICVARFAYHFWRIDTACRAFPYDMKDDIEIMKARWEIGLIRELEDFRAIMADVCMLGKMSTRLSVFLANRLAWANIQFFPPEIRWDLLPKGDDIPPVPCIPWMFGAQSNYYRSQDHWWENPRTDDGKPQWWTKPDRTLWLLQVRVPADLIGRYVASLIDAEEVLENATQLIETLAAGEDIDVNEFPY